MRTAVANHELLPKGPRLESLSIEAGHIGCRVASGTGRSRCPVCGLVSSRAHSRYSRTVSDLPHSVPPPDPPMGRVQLGWRQPCRRSGRAVR